MCVRNYLAFKDHWAQISKLLLCALILYNIILKKKTNLVCHFAKEENRFFYYHRKFNPNIQRRKRTSKSLAN